MSEIIDLHAHITNRIFDLGEEVELIMDGSLEWDEERLLVIMEEMEQLEARLGDEC